MLRIFKRKDNIPVTSTTLSVKQKIYIVTRIDKLLNQLSIQEHEVINELYDLRRKLVTDNLTYSDLEKLNEILLLKIRIQIKF